MFGRQLGQAKISQPALAKMLINIGISDYDNYVEHMKTCNHPDKPYITL